MNFTKSFALAALSLVASTAGPVGSASALDRQARAVNALEAQVPRTAATGTPALEARHERPTITPLTLAFERWSETSLPHRQDERLADLLASLDPSPRGLTSRHERIVLRLESSSESFHELPRLGPPLVSGVLEELPILGQAWAIANDLVPASSERLRDLTLELGGDSLLPDAFRDFGGALARGPYSRTDDANGSSTTIDLRVVLSWRPSNAVHLEAGYAVAYAGGEYGAQLEGQSGRHAEFFRHGPWAAIGLEF